MEAVAEDLLQDAILLGFLRPPVSSRKDMGQCQPFEGERERERGRFEVHGEGAPHSVCRTFLRRQVRGHAADDSPSQGPG